MPGLVAQFPVAAFTTPVNGDDLDAAVVVSHDNTTATAHTSHDADGTIHFQSSTLAARPGAGTPGRKWVTTDGLRVYYDAGGAWSEIDYLCKAAGGTVAGVTTFSADLIAATRIITPKVTSGGSVILEPAGGFGIIFNNGAGASTWQFNYASHLLPSTDNAFDIGIVATNRVRNVIAVNLTGTVATAAQPLITSLGTLTAVTVAGTITATGGVLTFSGFAGTAKIVGGTTGTTVRNNADSADNFIVTDGGNATIRGTLTMSGGDISFVSGAARNIKFLRRIVADPTDFAINDNANANNNFLITDAGNATIRGTLAIGGALSGVTSLSMSAALTMSAAVSKLIPGVTSFSHRNNADSADNILIADAGGVTFRAGLSGITTLAMTGALSGATTGAFSSTVTADKINNVTGTAVVPTGVPTTVVSGGFGAQDGLYLVMVQVPGGAVNQSAYVFINSSLAVGTLAYGFTSAGGNITAITMSVGGNITVTQTSGGNLTIRATVLRLS